jgi:hypothetical protein
MIFFPYPHYIPKNTIIHFRSGTITKASDNSYCIKNKISMTFIEFPNKISKNTKIFYRYNSPYTEDYGMNLLFCTHVYGVEVSFNPRRFPNQYIHNTVLFGITEIVLP